MDQVKVQYVDSQLSGDPCLTVTLCSPFLPITTAVRISESDHDSWVLQVSMQWMHRWEDAGIYDIFVEGTHLATGSLIYTIKKSFHLVDLKC